MAPRPSLFYLAAGGLSLPVNKLLFRQRSSGVENVPAEGGCVLAANHQIETALAHYYSGLQAAG